LLVALDGACQVMLKRPLGRNREFEYQNFSRCRKKWPIDIAASSTGSKGH
jgi:deoxyadenosine/deoxycytidine kinase